MNKLDGQSMDLVKENVEKLKELFPSIVKEDKIDFDELELLLGENINRNNEQYSFTWNGKTEATKLAQKRSTGTLRPCKEESKDWDNTQNLYIEGDNLEVLRLLQASYNGRIKMIYIDPPYNTGHDFVYKDNFEDNIKNYKVQTGQAAKSNADTDGRYHTNWLNMMYPRLKLARNLLTDDGVIYISIDENEVVNLRKICDDVFGENNLIAEIIWKKKAGGSNDSVDIAVEHEYIAVYKKKENGIYKLPMPEERIKEYKYEDEKVLTHGKYTIKDLNDKSLQDSSGLHYDIECPDGTILAANENQWKCNRETFLKRLNDNRIIFKKNNGQWKCYYKIYLNEEKGELKYDDNGNVIPKGKNLSSIIDNVLNKDATLELKSIFNCLPFSYPKPTKLIEQLILNATKENDIILDFFSGSATTAHSILNLNSKQGTRRKFIMVQLPENLDENLKNSNEKDIIKAAINICDEINAPHKLTEVAKERIRRAGEKIENLAGLDGAIIVHRLTGKDKLTEKDVEEFKKSETYQQYLKDLDTGFKVFKLDSSNLKKWDNTPTKDIDTIKERIQTSMDYLKDDRNELDLVYEVMLKYGIDLSYPVRKTGNEKAYIVEAPEYKLLVCTMPNISLDDVESFANENVGTYLFADRCFGSDSLLINTEEILKSRNKEMRLF